MSKRMRGENRICFDAVSPTSVRTKLIFIRHFSMNMDSRQQALVEFFSVLLYLLTPATTEYGFSWATQVRELINDNICSIRSLLGCIPSLGSPNTRQSRTQLLRIGDKIRTKKPQIPK